MDATLHHDPFLPDGLELSGEDREVIAEKPPEPIRHADDKETVAVVRELIASKVDVYEGHVRATFFSDAEEPPEPYNHAQDKNSIASVKKLLDRKALAAHKKRMSDVAA